MKSILSGKARGSKLIVLSVFLIGLYIIIDMRAHGKSYSILTTLAAFSFGAGVAIYRTEAEIELEKMKK